MANLKQELTTLDLCKMFGVSRQSIFNWRKAGLEYYKLGGNGLSDPTRYNLESVRKFAVEKNKVICTEIYFGSYSQRVNKQPAV